MPYTSQIVEYINTVLKDGKLKRNSFQGGKFNGLAKQLLVSKDDTLIPAIFDLEGNGIDVTIDDTYPIHLYHRITQPITYASAPRGQGFGDEDPIKESCTVSCIVYADPNRVNITAEDLAFLIVAGMPSRFNLISVNDTLRGSCQLGVSGTETNPLKVLAQEHGNQYKEFDPSKILISINYRIDTTVEKSCVDCETC